MKTIQIFVALAILLLLSACSSKSINMYTLTPSPSQMHAAGARYSSIRVEYPKGIEDTMGTRIYYTRSDLTQSYYLYNQWSDSLNRLILSNLIEALQSNRIAKHVLDYASEANADYDLETTIYRFEHKITPQGSYADISIGLRLLRNRDKKILKSRRFNYLIPCKSTDAKGFVEAANEAMHRLSTQMLTWLRR